MNKKSHLIIGYKGFIGSNLVKIDYFKKKKKFLIDKNTNNNLKVNLVNAKSVYNFLEKKKPSYIWNLSGSYSNNFYKDFQNNLIINFNIFESVRKLNLKSKILVVGSASEYGLNYKKKPISISEDGDLNPNSLYAWSKVSLFYLCKYFAQIHKLNIIYARIFNIYGDGINYNLFPGKINKLIKLKKLDINKIKELNSKRDYSDIKDIVKKLKKVMLKGKNGNAYNIGSGKLTSNIDLINRILKK